MYQYHNTYAWRRKWHRFPFLLCLLILITLFLGFNVMQFITSPKALAADIAQYHPAQEGASALALSAECAVLYDMNQDAILYEKNYMQRSEPGSLTKLLTVLTACIYHDNAIRYTVGDEIDLIGYNSSIAYLRKGDILSFEAIVDAVMLSSGNDATFTLAVNLARYHGGAHLSDEEALSYFVGLMNETAQAIGCTDSNFITVDGYPDTQHYSTPMDLLRIAIAAANSETVAKSMARSRAYHVFYSGRDVVWETTNKLLKKDSSYYYAYATGMKTGSTSSTDYSLAASADKDGTKLIAIILGAPSDGERFSDAVLLFESAFSPDKDQLI